MNFLRNLKIRYKIFFIFIVLFLLMLDLAVLNITSVHDIQQNTARISDELIPRLVTASTLKDNLNLAILAAYDYVQNGSVASKTEYQAKIHEAVLASVQLFQHASAEKDFEFVQSFQNHINDINQALEELVEAYENGDRVSLSTYLQNVAEKRDAFSSFLSQQVEESIQNDVALDREHTQKEVRQTIMNVAAVGLLAFVAYMMLIIFIRRSVTEPLATLTAAARDIGKGHFRQVDITTRDELGLFAETFNTMTQKIAFTQEALRIELEKTRKLDQQKTEFLSIAAHQLRTPMSGIKWMVNMAVEGDFGKLPEEAGSQLRKGLENVERMIRLINSLLDVTQMETQKLHYDFQPNDIVALCKSIIDELQPIAKHAVVDFFLNPPPAPLPLVVFDKEKMRLALRNLMDNAIKYTRPGGTVIVQPRQYDAHHAVVYIIDTGVGIPADEQDRLFTKFYRGTNVQTIQADGSGLGLFVVDQIVKMHNGSVRVQSEINKGSTFSVILPFAESVHSQ